MILSDKLQLEQHRLAPGVSLIFDMDGVIVDSNPVHRQAWAAFNRRIKANSAVGIWHETYIIDPVTAENIYTNMPPFGLGAVGELAPAKGRMAGLRDPFTG